MRDTGHRTPVQGAADTVQGGRRQRIPCGGAGGWRYCAGGRGREYCAGTPEDWETSPYYRIYTPETQSERSNTSRGKGEGHGTKGTQIGFTSDSWLKDPQEAPLIERAITCFHQYY